GRHASSAIDSRGPEGRAVAMIIDSIAQHIIKTEKNVDEAAEVICSEEVDRSHSEQQRGRSSAVRLHVRTSCGGRVIRKGGRATSSITSFRWNVAVLTFPRICSGKLSEKRRLKTEAKETADENEFRYDCKGNRHKGYDWQCRVLKQVRTNRGERENGFDERCCRPPLEVF